MKKRLTIIIITLVFTSCVLNRISIDQTIERFTDRIELKITVKKYVIKRGKYFGSIETTNNTRDTLFFNFNQAILVLGDTIMADYNIKPVSYAEQAFYILPNSTATWNVAWALQSKDSDCTSIILLADTNIFTVSELRKTRP